MSVLSHTCRTSACEPVLGAAAATEVAGRTAEVFSTVGVGCGTAAEADGGESRQYPKPSSAPTIRMVTPHEIPVNRRGDLVILLMIPIINLLSKSPEIPDCSWS